MRQRSWKPWDEVVQLRDDLKTGTLSLAVFAVSLASVAMAGQVCDVTVVTFDADTAAVVAVVKLLP